MVKYKVCMQKNEKYFYNRVLLVDLRFCKLYAEIFYGFGTTHKIKDYLITQSEQSTIYNVLVRYNSTLSQSICLFERISILEIFLFRIVYFSHCNFRNENLECIDRKISLSVWKENLMDKLWLDSKFIPR